MDQWDEIYLTMQFSTPHICTIPTDTYAPKLELTDQKILPLRVASSTRVFIFFLHLFPYAVANVDRRFVLLLRLPKLHIFFVALWRVMRLSSKVLLWWSMISMQSSILVSQHVTGPSFMVRAYFYCFRQKNVGLERCGFEFSCNCTLYRCFVGMALQVKSGLDHIPVTLLPTPFPKQQLKKAMEVQQYFNKIFFRVRSDPVFIAERLRETAAADPFTGRLLNMFNTLEDAGVLKDQLSLSIHRNDYMLHDDTNGSVVGAVDQISSTSCSIQQVEVNTISCAFGGLAPEPRRMHRYMLTKVHPPALDNVERLPNNGARGGLVDALIRAATTFNREFKIAESAILMVEYRCSSDVTAIQHSFPTMIRLLTFTCAILQGRATRRSKCIRPTGPRARAI